MSTGTFLREMIRGRALVCGALVGGIVAVTGATAHAGPPAATPTANGAAPVLGVPVTVELSQSVTSEDGPREEIFVTATWIVRPDGHWKRILTASNGFHEEASGILEQERNQKLQELAASSAVTEAARQSPLDMGCPENKINFREDVGSTHLEVNNICMGGNEGRTPEWSADQIAAWKTIEEIGALAMPLDGSLPARMKL